MKRVFFLVSLILGLLLFLFTVQQAGIDDVLKTVSTFTLQIIIAVFLINFIAVAIIGSLRWKLILESQNVCDVGFFKILRAKLAGFLVSYITPSVLVGGEPVRAYMIKERSNCSWEKSFASVVIDQTIYFFTIFLFMIIGFLFLVKHSSLPAEIFYSFGIIVIFVIFTFCIFYSKTLNGNSNKDGFFMFFIKAIKLDKIKFIKAREKNIDATEKIVSHFFKNKRKVFIEALVLSILEILFYLAVIWIIIFYLNPIIEITQTASIFFLLTLANFIPIPGSLGSFEMALTFVFDFFGFGKSNGFTFSLIYRIINIAIVFIGFFTLIYFELKTISHHFSLEAPKPLLKIHRFLVRIIRK
ncbi:flippase-like domain-containing protein [Candidatus Parcubacteria bacterium]|nr:flippase-like domain-containing protein [Candidatus Parcubacteria bacterium]